MTNILREIVEHKRGEVAERRELHPVKLLEKSIYFKSSTLNSKYKAAFAGILPIPPAPYPN